VPSTCCLARFQITCLSRPAALDYWRRELEVYQDASLRQQLQASGLVLPTGWLGLVAHRNELLDLMERLSRSRCPLDLWVSSTIRRPTGEIALLDWAFTSATRP
jgi:hypothetical protein